MRTLRQHSLDCSGMFRRLTVAALAPLLIAGGCGRRSEPVTGRPVIPLTAAPSQGESSSATWIYGQRPGIITGQTFLDADGQNVPGARVTLTGKVVRTSSLRLPDGSEVSVVGLSVVGEVVWAMLGTRRYLERHRVVPRVNVELTVTGVWSEVNGQRAILATALEMDGNTFQAPDPVLAAQAEFTTNPIGIATAPAGTD